MCGESSAAPGDQELVWRVLGTPAGGAGEDVWEVGVVWSVGWLELGLLLSLCDSGSPDNI